MSVGLFVGLAAATDLRMRRIPNYLTVPAALLGLAFHTFSSSGIGILSSLGGFAVGFCLLLLPSLLGGGGMGDVKLLAALGAWLGVTWLLIAFVVSVSVSACMALAVLLYGATQHGVSGTSKRYLGARRQLGKSGRKRPARVLPFAVPVAISTYALLSWLVVRGDL